MSRNILFDSPDTSGVRVFEFTDEEAEHVLRKFFPQATPPVPKPHHEWTLLPMETGFKGVL